MTWELRQDHVLTALRSLEAESVDCVVTSPPYWGLRSYGTVPQVWGAGELGCEHEWDAQQRSGISGGVSVKQDSNVGSRVPAAHIAVCLACGAWRGELGSEPTIALYIEHLMMVFNEVRRVLRSDGTCWVNIGDSYAGSGKGPSHSIQPAASQIGGVGGVQRIGPQEHTTGSGAVAGLKPKDLCLIPERFAIAMQEAGWWVRSRIAWCKTSAMPESVQDRPTSAWEHIWLFTKSRNYFYDAAAVKEPPSENTHRRTANHEGSKPSINFKMMPAGSGNRNNSSFQAAMGDLPPGTPVNQRNHWWIESDNLAWLLVSEPYPDAHFATFPVEIPKRCILAGSPIGGMVLDPFAGSGTTLFAAEEQGRDSIGIELNPAYSALARKRLAGARTPLPGLLT